jgi:hypothetical protein
MFSIFLQVRRARCLLGSALCMSRRGSGNVARTPCFAPLQHKGEIAAKFFSLLLAGMGFTPSSLCNRISSTSAAQPVVFTPLCRDYLFRTITLSQVLM